MSGDEDQPSNSTIRFRITPESTYYAAADQRTKDEQFELQEALARALPDDVDRRPAPGEKGVLTDVVLPLAAGGGFTAMTEVFKAWLAKRPTNRTIHVEYEINRGEQGGSGTLDLDATNVEDDVLGAIAKEALASREE